MVEPSQQKGLTCARQAANQKEPELLEQPPQRKAKQATALGKRAAIQKESEVKEEHLPVQIGRKQKKQNRKLVEYRSQESKEPWLQNDVLAKAEAQGKRP